MNKIILHCDLNNFYASVECLKNPEYKNVALAVAGNPKKRTGIILAKNIVAKALGIKTGDAIWQAKLLSPDLICVSPDFDTYAKFSEQVKSIYQKYTDFVEPFGIDECWLDVTKSQKLFGNGYQIANKIKEEIKKETGLTISVGVSFSKMFAKLGSKTSKPDSVNIISKSDYKEKVWNLPVEKLIFVGKRRLVQLKKININTIGDLANAPEDMLVKKFGINGAYLKQIANGEEPDKVSNINNLREIKSVGNGTTSIFDISNFVEAKQIIFYLCETIAKRLREKGFKSLSIHFSIKDNNFETYSHSKTFDQPTNNASDLAKISLDLLKKTWDFEKQKNLIRAIRISASSLIGDKNASQFSFFENNNTEKKAKGDKAIDNIKNKYGLSKIKRALLLKATHINCEISENFFE